MVMGERSGGVSGEGLASAYRRDARSLLVFLARRTCDAQAASDLVGETFAEALASRRSFRGSSDADLSAWLFGIARNLLLGYLKRGRIERRALDRLGIERAQLNEGELERIEELAGLAELRARVAGQLERLSEESREAIRLRIVDELPYPAVAERLAISEDAARARVSRGLRRIAADLNGCAAEVAAE